MIEIIEKIFILCEDRIQWMRTQFSSPIFRTIAASVVSTSLYVYNEKWISYFHLLGAMKALRTLPETRQNCDSSRFIFRGLTGFNDYPNDLPLSRGSFHFTLIIKRQFAR